MPEPVSLTIGGVCLIGYTAMRGITRTSGATSDEAKYIGNATAAIIELAERSYALYGEKLEAVEDLKALAVECVSQGWDGENADPINSVAIIQAELVIKLLPRGIPMPSFSPNSDGSVSADWIQSRNRIFSLNISQSSRFAYAWTDGTDKGHGVALFNGWMLPPRIIEGIRGIVENGAITLRAA